ncbi:hypothetical protein, partial [Pseudomonas syringae]|uniref:hypothetical protein n=1 Tax=Pseudomonas syringae TaxID=317 RepID=UPI001F16C82A
LDCPPKTMATDFFKAVTPVFQAAKIKAIPAVSPVDDGPSTRNSGKKIPVAGNSCAMHATGKSDGSLSRFGFFLAA